MNRKAHLLNLLVGLVLIPSMLCAQVDFNKTPNDDLGNNENKFQEYFFEAIKQKGIENYEKAIEYVQKCIQINPEEASLYFELGKNHNKLGNSVLAANALKKALELNNLSQRTLTRSGKRIHKSNNLILPICQKSTKVEKNKRNKQRNE